MGVNRRVVHLERVCCLECGTNYVRPVEGTASRPNPGCPMCAYPGWISAVVPETDAANFWRRHHFGADPPPSPADRLR